MARNIVEEQRRPHKDKKLPRVLSKTEVLTLFEKTPNLKHRLLLMPTYSSGLRVSEVVRLKKGDIDTERKMVFIKEGKGRKDRYTILSTKVVTLLSEYLLKYDIKGWLFPGQPADKPLSTRSAQKIFYEGLEKAGIEKEASIHTLRHSFATHLVESDTNLGSIQKLLGHKSLRTTMRYIHGAKKDALAVVSPLDSIDITET
jgi:site-specific recombinase XerD